MDDLEKVVTPLRCALFTSTSDLLGMQCFHSTLGPYQADRFYSIYDIPSLMRILLKKNESLGENLSSFLQKNQENIICRVVEWTPYAKSFLLIDVGSDVEFDDESFFNLMQDVESLQYHFDKIYIAQKAAL